MSEMEKNKKLRRRAICQEEMVRARQDKNREPDVEQETAVVRVATAEVWAVAARGRAGIVYAPSAVPDNRISRVFRALP